jgi:hypothetical protein
VSLLGLSAQAGRDAEAAHALRIENAGLRGQVARLGSTERLQAEGAKLGLVMPAAAKIHYLTVRPGVDGPEAVKGLGRGPIGTSEDIIRGTPPPAPVVAAPQAGTPAGAPQAGTPAAPGTTTGAVPGAANGAAPGTVPGTAPGTAPGVAPGTTAPGATAPPTQPPVTGQAPATQGPAPATGVAQQPGG